MARDVSSLDYLTLLQVAAYWSEAMDCVPDDVLPNLAFAAACWLDTKPRFRSAKASSKDPKYLVVRRIDVSEAEALEALKSASNRAHTPDHEVVLGRLEVDREAFRCWLTRSGRRLPDFWFAWERETAEKPLANKRRDSMLLVIAALANEAKIDITKTSTSAGVIEEVSTLVGAPVSSTTIESILKEIPDAIEKRKK